MIGFLRSLACWFRPSCRLFDGDDFTDWVKAQGQASRAGRHQLQREATGNFFDDALDGLDDRTDRKGDRQ